METNLVSVSAGEAIYTEEVLPSLMFCKLLAFGKASVDPYFRERCHAANDYLFRNSISGECQPHVDDKPVDVPRQYCVSLIIALGFEQGVNW